MDAREREREHDEERDEQHVRGGTFDTELHNMGGDVGPVSIRGSNASPGGRPSDDAEPTGGWSTPMGYMAGRDDEWPETAGSDEKAISARTDEIEGHIETAGPSPRPVPDSLAGPRDNPDAARRARGPVETGPEDAAELPTHTLPPSGHVTPDLGWSGSDADDPDGGSGRTDEDDGGYLPGEGTGRPPG